jgi:hypothetical protein
MLTPGGFDIEFMYAATVPPKSGEPVESISIESIEISQGNGLNSLLKLFDDSLSKCKIGITWISNANQENEIRTSALSIIAGSFDEKKESSEFLAKRLASFTDERIKTGLLIIMSGKKARTNRLVILRFKAEEVLVREYENNRYVIKQFNEGFIKVSNYYKIACFEDDYAERGCFWDGFLLDHQKKDKISASDYWIKDFLMADYQMSPIQGTLHLSENIKKFAKQLQSTLEQEIVVNSVRNLLDSINEIETFSINDYIQGYLPQNLQAPFLNSVMDDSIIDTVFNIDAETLKDELPFKVLQMQNQICLTVPTFLTDEIIETEELENGLTEYKFKGRLNKIKFSNKI